MAHTASPLAIRLPDAWRNSPDAVASIQIPTPTGERIPLSRLAEVQIVEGPSTITREWGQRRIVVTANARGRDLGSFVREVQETLKSERYLAPWPLPSGLWRPV